MKVNYSIGLDTIIFVYKLNCNMTKRGRPKKKDAVKSGELQSNLCRFSFIAEKKIVALIKKKAKQRGLTIKDYMNELLADKLKDIEKKTDNKQNNVEHQNLLKEYLQRKQS